ncbi:MAG: contractile injection system tape measure protein [Salibacteraceae bacterium]
MTATGSHIIKKQVLDIQVDTMQESAAIQDRVRELFYQRVVPRLEKEFDQQCPENVVLRLDTLTLDLGEFQPQTLERDWEERTEILLMEQVREQIQVARLLQLARGEEDLTEASESLELLKIYLKSGNLPWWRKGVPSLDQLLQTVLDESGKVFLDWLQENRASNSMLTRLYHHFSQENVVEVLARLLALDQGRIQHVVAALGHAFESKEKTWITALQVSLEQEAPNWAKLLPFAQEKSAEHRLVSRLALELAKTTGKAPDLRIELPQLETSLAQEIKEAMLKAASKGQQTEEEPQAEEAEAPEEIFIQNAGLVLFWPYLDELFKSLKLTYNGEFINDFTRQKAVYVLQHLATGKAPAAEFELALNKLLCGHPMTEPLVVNTELNPEQQAEVNLLVTALIHNWDALSNTSDDGFRSSFVQREGRLRFEHGEWYLKVHRESFDLLLDKLPWSIGTVHLPWMPAPLYIEW